MRHMIVLIALSLAVPALGSPVTPVDPKRLRAELKKQRAQSSEAREVLFEATQRYSRAKERQERLRERHQRPLQPKNAAPAEVVAPASAGPIDSELFARFIDGKYKVKPRAKVVHIDPSAACRKKANAMSGRVAKRHLRKCVKLAKKFKEERAARLEQFRAERTRVERERRRYDREQYRRQRELRGDTLTY